MSITNFRTHVCAVVRHVETTGEAVEITRRGQVVARLVPAPKKIDRRRLEDILAEREQLAAELKSGWPKEISAAEAVAQDRRDL